MEQIIMSHNKRSKKTGLRTKRKSAKVDNLAILNPNAAGIDIGSRTHYVAVRADRCDEPVQNFESLTPELHRLADWLESCGVKTVAMESTGVYWVPVYEILEARGFEVCLVNAHDVHNVPGRKSDVLDCQWLQQLHSFGLLRASFRPTAQIVELRSYLRHRDTLVRDCGRLIQRMQKALTLMNLQLHTVISDITGKTGMSILRDIAAGERDPRVLAKHRDPRCRANLQRIADSLTGNYRPEHLLSLRHALSLYDAHQQLIRDCDTEVEPLLNDLASNAPEDCPPLLDKSPRPRKHEPQFDLRELTYQITGVDLTALPGIGAYTVASIISEIGLDMTRWPSVKHFGSWLRLAPGTKITGGKIISARTLPTSSRATELLRMAAVCAGKTSTAIGAFYRRLAARKGKARAVVATAYKIARTIYVMLRDRTPFDDTLAAMDEKQQQKRKLRSLKRQAAALGLRLVADADESVQPQTPALAITGG